MYPVSNDYVQAIRKLWQNSYVTGRILDIADFNMSNIREGSLSITWQCSDNMKLEIGTVYISELCITLINMPDMPRYTWYGKRLEIEFTLMVDAVPVTIPMGVYTIREANWTGEGVQVKAYDNMAKFDEKFDYLVCPKEGFMYDFARYACEKCGVELGMTAEQMAAMPNGGVFLALYEKNDIETFRDLISWCAQTLAAFATIGRDGRLVFRNFTRNTVHAINANERWQGASFSDFVTDIKGVTLVRDNEIDIIAGESKQTIYDLGMNPFLQYYPEGTDAIFESLQNAKYVPFTATVAPNPMFDLGDVVQFHGGIADDLALSCITKITFDYPHGTVLQGVGENPAVSSAPSGSGGGGGSGGESSSGGNYVTYKYVNGEHITLGENMKVLVIDLKFSTMSNDADIDIWMEICLSVLKRLDVVTCTVSYMLSSDEISYHPVETWDEDGKHILALHYFMDGLAGNRAYQWKVFLTLSGGSGEIEVENIHALLRGNGLSATLGKWDGTLELTDEVPTAVMELFVKDYTDDVSVYLDEFPHIILSESVSAVVLNRVIANHEDVLNEIEADMMIYTPHTNEQKVSAIGTGLDSSVGWTGAGNHLAGTAASVTTGVVRGIKSVTGVSVGAVFYVSEDGGATWLGISDGIWRENTAMSSVELFAVTEAEWALLGDVIIRAYLDDGCSLYSLNLYGAEEVT